MKTKTSSIILFLSIFFCLLTMTSGCFLVKKFAGADIDPEQFAKAREAKITEIRWQSLSKLEKRLSSGDPLENADITFYISEDLLNKLAKQYDSSSGWLDESTTFIVKSVNLDLINGCAIASLGLTAHNDSYNVDVDLMMDCLMTIDLEKNNLTARLEPFNISPAVSTGALLSSAKEIISNLIKINLANIGKNFSDMKIPVDFSNNISIAGTNTKIKNKVNLIINNPSRNINFRLKLKEVLIFEKKAFVALNVEGVEVK